MTDKEKTDTIEMVKQMVTDGQVNQEVAERYFLELKESEGERMRKWTINYLNNRILNSTIIAEKENLKKAIAWLEKQGEKMPPEYTLEQAAGIFLDALSNTPYNNKPITDAQVITKELLKFLEDTSSYNPNAINEQKPAWSEEDEKLVKNLISTLSNLYARNLIEKETKEKYTNLLKSLKDRVQPQNTWKPSDEQITWLYRAADEARKDSRMKQVLNELLSDLKKLIEE